MTIYTAAINRDHVHRLVDTSTDVIVARAVSRREELPLSGAESIRTSVPGGL
jgi:hypothetical protein